jgi:cytochrome c oxidase cbb3-type subunit 3
MFVSTLIGNAQPPAGLQQLGPPAAGAGRVRSSVGSQGPLPTHESYPQATIANGQTLFVQQCGFCHGRDASGGESGPDLTKSRVVSSDKAGEAIGQVIHNGRPDKGMPSFSLSDSEVTSLVAFIHYQQDQAMSQNGNRKGVSTADLQTGNAEAGKKYFDGAGTCSTCHSATGDLAGIASRLQGLRLEEQMLMPRAAASKVTVTTADGKTITGAVAYHDEFTIGLIDQSGGYHSWPTSSVKYKIDNPTDAHVQLLSKYSDDDIHNLMAYLQTLR